MVSLLQFFIVCMVFVLSLAVPHLPGFCFSPVCVKSCVSSLICFRRFRTFCKKIILYIYSRKKRHILAKIEVNVSSKTDVNLHA